MFVTDLKMGNSNLEISMTSKQSTVTKLTSQCQEMQADLDQTVKLLDEKERTVSKLREEIVKLKSLVDEAESKVSNKSVAK